MMWVGLHEYQLLFVVVVQVFDSTLSGCDSMGPCCESTSPGWESMDTEVSGTVVTIESSCLLSSMFH